MSLYYNAMALPFFVRIHFWRFEMEGQYIENKQTIFDCYYFNIFCKIWRQYPLWLSLLVTFLSAFLVLSVHHSAKSDLEI